MPRALIDLRMVFGRLHGIARYSLELARQLPRLERTWEFLGLVPPEGLPPDLGALAPPFETVRARAGFLSAFEQPALWADLRRLKPDLFHATSFSLPALWRGRLVATLHDANHLALPEEYGLKQRLYYRAVVAPRAATADALLTVSEFSKGELSARLQIPPDRFQVIMPGVSSAFSPKSAKKLQAFRERMKLPPRYFALVGNTKPFKNLASVARIAATLPLPIALAAGKGAASALGFPETTIELPALSEEDLCCLFAGATALLMPSRYEGFGLPALESLACGTPVIHSEAPALQEVVGDAGICVKADDDAGWRDACQRLARDEALRRALAFQGIERSSCFRWESCARQTLWVYERVLGIT